MKNLLVALLLCCYSSLAFSQEVVVVSSSRRTNLNDDKSAKTFNASIRCYYTFSQANEKTEKMIRIDTMALLIGDTQSKFYNPAKYTRDSIFGSILSNVNPNTIQSVSVMKDASLGDLSSRPGETSSTNSNDGESYQIIKNRNTNSLYLYDYFGMSSDSYGYNDKPVFSWKISQDTASILGYPCQKATADFRGRTYTAWFSTDIPINDGPWKFMGLPGLILKINDSKNLFGFELIGIENITESYAVQIPKARYDCNHKQFEGMKQKQGGGMQINVNGGNIIIASAPGKYEYNPIELNIK